MLNIRHGVKYLLHRFAANNRHGLHSPFIYRLVDSVIYDFRAKDTYTALKIIHNQHKNDQHLSLPLRVLQLLYRLLVNARPQQVLIAGNSSSAFVPTLHLAAPQAQCCLLRIDDIPLGWKADLIFIGTSSLNTELKKEADQCLPYVKESTLLIVQSVHQNRHMQQAWADLKASSSVTVTVDLFWFQLIYFKKGQAKEHFKVKY